MRWVVAGVSVVFILMIFPFVVAGWFVVMELAECNAFGREEIAFRWSKSKIRNQHTYEDKNEHASGQRPCV